MASESDTPPSTSHGKDFANKSEDYVLSFIDGTLEGITRELTHPNGRPAITLKRRSSHASHSVNEQTGALEFDGNNIFSTYSWPGRNTQEGWRFGTPPLYHWEPSITNTRDSNYSTNT